VETLRIQQPLRMCAGANMNGYFVVAPGKAGVERGVEYIGDSMVIGPWGNILRRAGTDGDELVIADLDLADAAEVQARLDLSTKRRPEAYRPLVERAGTPVVV
jgi:predicted amidohydrolase